MERRASRRDRDDTRGRSIPFLGVLWLVGLFLGTGCSAGVWGLRPVYPEARYRVIPNLRHGTTYVEVDSVQPTLRWEAFPRPQDREADKEGLLSRIRNVTYDLKIWRGEDDSPGDVVYARQGLPEPWHTLERPLEPSTKYLWTIRARFELDGRPRVTEWGVAKYPVPPGSITSRRSSLVPSPNHYRFETPEVVEGSAKEADPAQRPFVPPGDISPSERRALPY